MGAGRNKYTFSPNETSHSLGMTSNWKSARNLTKYQLGGVIFGCTRNTMRECLANQLFGLPAQHFSYVKNIEPGLPLFLFDYSEKNLHGIFEAACSGRMNINPYAWTDGSDRTRYPAQVQIRLRLQCQALPEYQFKPIIIDNYYGQAHFWFELDHAQASRLMSKFSSLAIAPRKFIQNNPPKWMSFSTNNKKEEIGASEPPHLPDDFFSSNDSIATTTTSDNSLGLNENTQLAEASLGNQVVELNEKELIYMKLKELSCNWEFSDANIMETVVGEASKSGMKWENGTRDDNQVTWGIGGSHSDPHDYPAIIEQLSWELEELKTFKQEQTEKMKSVEEKLAEAEQEIHRLGKRCMDLESISNNSTQSFGAQFPVETPDEFELNLSESILLVGGYNGVSFSSALHAFSPSEDVLRSLKTMSSIRSYASFAKFNGELYVFGGGCGSMWYDSVESYNIVNNEWTLRPSLNKEKGSLAGAALNNKLFAIGGGNGLECFSDVEMFDPYVGRWIPSRSMLQKRFALAGVELNGALYAVGGYDGNEYLKTAERYDPREHSWTRIGTMEARRGCLSVVTMNEKIYALGGFDGTTMVPSVEIYDPRLGTWMPGEPMNYARGYSAAAVLNESIYVIGGVEADEEIVEKIECYKEGGGWEATNLRAIGKRCFASAIVVGGD
ncbi:hypothetical protein ACS0TY_016447 [Phlomoides rotata]